MKYWRLLQCLLRSFPRTYTVWKMNEIALAGGTLYSCATCGMARSQPCEHWRNMEAAEEGDAS